MNTQKPSDAMTLADTVPMMCNSDYKERLKGEYYQIELRCQGLQDMLLKWSDGKLPFTPTAPRAVYERQLLAMGAYKMALEKRLAAENLSDIIC